MSSAFEDGRKFKDYIRVPDNLGEVFALSKRKLGVGQKLGLVHDIFNCKLGHRPQWDDTEKRYIPYTDEERFEWLFGVADGWHDVLVLRTPRYGADRTEPQFYFARHPRGAYQWDESELRQLIAEKAFAKLAAHLFSIPAAKKALDRFERQQQENAWLNSWVGKSPLFPLLQRFFCPEDTGYGTTAIRNLSRARFEDDIGHSEKIARQFLLKLARALWAWKPPAVHRPYGDDAERMADYARELEDVARMRQRIDEAKPWMVLVLAHLNRLEILEGVLPRLERPCVAVLHRLATAAPAHHDQPFLESVEAGCLEGRAAAWLLIHRQVLRKELARSLRKKHVRLLKESQEQREAQRREAIATARTNLDAAAAQLRQLGEETA